MTGISTIMQNDCEVIVLHFLYYLLNENRRVLPAILIRQESGSGSGHHYPIHPCSLQCHTVTENEIRTFLQQRIRRFRIDINKHHDFRHIIQTSCQWVRPMQPAKTGLSVIVLAANIFAFRYWGTLPLFKAGMFSFSISSSLARRRPTTLGTHFRGRQSPLRKPRLLPSNP